MSSKIVFAGLAGRPKPKPAALPGQQKPKARQDDGQPSAPEPVFLNIDILELVLDKLEVQDLARASQVSREWRAAAASADSAWRRAFEAEFGADKARDFTQLRTWRDKYIACLLHTTQHKLRSKARYLDELEDSAGLLEKNAQTLLAGLNQIDRTLSHRRHELSALLASVTGKRGAHADSALGKEVLELLAKGGDLRRFSRLTPDSISALLDMQRDVEFWKGNIAEEREALHRMWDSLSYINSCCKKARGEIAECQQRRALLEQATLYRPTVRRT